jgi:hypothetical protein
MAKKQVLTEINLTSNAVILGVAGKDHPLPLYRKFGVPVSFSTDDEGVSRIDLTHEYVRAVETYDFGYSDLKQMGPHRHGIHFPAGSRSVGHAQRLHSVRFCLLGGYSSVGGIFFPLHYILEVQREGAAAMGARAPVSRL